MMSEIKVLKRSGVHEPLDLNKLHKVVMWACEGLSGVSASEVEIRSSLSIKDSISSSDIQETMIRAAAELISEDAPNYQFVAGRLVNYHLRKQVFGSYEPPRLYDHVKRVVELGYYDRVFLDEYTEEEWDAIEKFVKHSRDDDIVYAGMEQFRGKYLVKNRVTGQIFETPQIAYVLIAAFLFHRYPPDNRLSFVKEYYDAISTFVISLPTPVMAGVRTPQRQFSSCVLIEADDDLNSIFSTAHAIGLYVSQKAGIGIGAGKLRPIGSPVRNGDTATTGVIPYYRLWQAAVKSCSQGGVRGGAATLYFPIWHPEVEDLLVLKNNKGTEFNRVRQLDYGVQFCKLFYERLINGGNISLMSPRDVPGLYDAFFADQDKFKKLYEAAERNKNIKKKVIPAIDLFSAFMNERKNTGRLYLMNVDHANEHGSFIPSVAPIRMSNLCAEITLPTSPIYNVEESPNHPLGEIALCILSAINWGKIKSPHDFEGPCNLAVRALDELIDIQSYPLLAAEIGTRSRRSLGIGIINLAYFLAKNDLTYDGIDTAGLALVDEYMEAMSYYLIKASNDLAKEKGCCAWSTQTKYSMGIVPIDTYKRSVDELVPHAERMDWTTLRQDLDQFGIRNSTLMACMPAETSAQLSNSTNGVEPINALVTVKQSKDGVLPQVAPEVRRLKNKYDLRWEQRSPIGYLSLMAVLQKHMDQSISTNTSYNPEFYPDRQIPMSEMLQHLVFCYKFGIKTAYYFNTNDQAGELSDLDNVKPDPDVVPDVVEEDCDSCKI